MASLLQFFYRHYPNIQSVPENAGLRSRKSDTREMRSHVDMNIRGGRISGIPETLATFKRRPGIGKGQRLSDRDKGSSQLLQAMFMGHCEESFIFDKIFPMNLLYPF